jgi:Protein of unknown function (DUF3050)
MRSLGAHETLMSLRARLVDHRLYGALQRPADVRIFQQHHVFCVWDFMTLLKALQRRVTCVEVPWLPAPDPVACRLVNEIVLGEESDEDGKGGHCSHFELYLASMHDTGADSGPVGRLIAALRAGRPLEEALRDGSVPPKTAAFVRLSLEIAGKGELHRLAAAFGLGREDVIPSMFVQLLERLSAAEPNRFGRFLFYLKRHVDLDGDSHGPATMHLIERVCGTDPQLRQEAVETACKCLEARLQVWDEIHTAVTNAAASKPASGGTA